MRPIIITVITVLMTLICTNIFAAAPEFNPKDLSVTWEVVKNDAPKSGQSLNAIAITNNGKNTLPASGWKLYFNCARMVLPNSPTANVKIDFVNGDLFSMTPTNTFTELKPGASVRIEFVDDDLVVNITDGPEGFYLVWDNDPGNGHNLGAFTIKPFSPNYAGLVTDTTWYALYGNNVIVSIALLYSGMTPSTLLMFYEKDPTNSRVLLGSIRKSLPNKFNVHLSPGLIDLFGMENIAENYGHNHRMVLKGDPEPVNDENIKRLESGDLSKINELYSIAYPHNWFDSRMLKTGKYFGYFESSTLVGIAGIHVYSPEYRIAALGNIATHPGFRGRRIAYKITSVLCNDLKKSTDIIGLNVKSDNKAAIKCYQNIGFEIRSSFDEYLIKK